MPYYNPIVRTFCRVRSALVNQVGVDRRAVHPDTPLAVLVPAVRRDSFLRELCPETSRHEANPTPGGCIAAILMAATFLGIGMLMSMEPLAVMAAILFAALLLALWLMPNPEAAADFPLGLRTVGELVVWLTRFRDHRQSGCRWTRSERALKVRMIVAEQLGIPLDQVREDSVFVDLLG